MLPLGVSVKEEDVIVVGSIARENVALAVAVAAMPVAPSAGVRAVTVGGAGALAQVVNDQETALESGTPSEAVTAVDRRAVYVVERASGAEGVSVAVWVVSSYTTVAATAPLGPARVKLEPVSVVGSTDREKTAFGATAVLMPVDASAGEVDVTCRGTATTVAKDHVAGLLSGVPSIAFAAVETVAV